MERIVNRFIAKMILLRMLMSLMFLFVDIAHIFNPKIFLYNHAVLFPSQDIIIKSKNEFCRRVRIAFIKTGFRESDLYFSPVAVVKDHGMIFYFVSP